MATKLKDLAVKTGEYTDRDGNSKGRWMNVGSLMQGSDGGMFIMLDRAFNPAGVPNPDNRSSVLVSCFDQRGQGGQANGNTGTAQGAYGGGSFGGMDDEVPF